MVEQSHTAGFWPSLYEPFRALGTKVADFFAPASEAGSDEDAYRIDLELPGVEEADIDISVADNVLTVKGEKRTTREETKGAVYFCERQYGSFQRSFRLPGDANGSAVDATFRNGVLTLSVPRLKPEQPKATKVQIRSG
ncbi:MAG: Hsp20/alpha crystallin family protein [Pseudomonadota bacterium]